MFHKNIFGKQLGESFCRVHFFLFWPSNLNELPCVNNNKRLWNYDKSFLKHDPPGNDLFFLVAMIVICASSVVRLFCLNSQQDSPKYVHIFLLCSAAAAAGVCSDESCMYTELRQRCKILAVRVATPQPAPVLVWDGDFSEKYAKAQKYLHPPLIFFFVLSLSSCNRREM
jgi:hypothetical protein